MDLHKTQKCSHLPRTSRVNDKILEYYTKFGKDRDLEKFMRLHSPNNRNSGSSSGSSPKSCCEIFNVGKGQSKAMRRLFVTENCERDQVSESSTSKVRGTEKAETEQKVERVIPIILEEHEERGAKTNTESTSQDDSIETPTKSQRTQTKPVKTPDSIAKTHKRLEWDSLGDVGYIKSMSTSNISVLERSILREFFQETSTTSTSNKNVTNASEGDLLKKLKQDLFLDDARFRKSDTAAAKAVPLASSTLLETNARGARPKYTTTEAAPSNLPQQQEQYVQTSIENLPSKQSREVQVNMTEAAVSHSTDGNSSTRSNLEYTFVPCSSTEESDGAGRSSRAHKPHFTADMLSQRRVLADRNNGNAKHNNSLTNLFEISQDLVKALVEDKENALKMPQLDLGIQLLCSLIDAKSLSRKDKKQLVRDIVKRITQLGIDVCDLSETDSSSRNHTERTTKSANASGLGNRIITPKPLKKAAENTNNEVPEDKSAHPDQNSNSSNSYKDEKVIDVQVYTETSPPTTSAKARQKQTEQSAKTETRSKTESDKVNNNIITDSKSTKANETNHTRIILCSSSSSSSDVIIEKASNDKSSSSDCNATMNEWLNPLTQSEIEYEQKKLELAEQLEREKRRQKQKLAKPDKEREVQLNWIDTEIRRLESLKNLLLKKDIGGRPDNQRKDNGTEKVHDRSKLPVITEQSEDKLYDQVDSEAEKSEENSSRTYSCKSAEHLLQEIEVIIEESNEDEVNFQTNLKRIKERKRETQIIYDNPNLEQELTAAPTGKPRFRTMKETVITHEEQVLPVDSIEMAQAPPRSKIDTPHSSNGSESVCSFVQQRKREFMEHYKNKKKKQYEALQQQKNPPQISSQYKANASTEARYGHYSVPNSAQHNSAPPQAQQHHSNTHHYKQPQRPYWQHHRFPSSAVDPAHSPAKPPHSTTRVSYSAGVASVHTSNSNTHSSSSTFAMSSEVSIPMGSNSTSSTTTTTHQYDDVAVGGSMPLPTTYFLHSRGPHLQPHRNKVDWQRHHYSAGVQMKPKSIAYDINFGTAKGPTNSVTKDSNRLTLQQHLQLARPKFCADSKDRKAILNKIQALRQERERELRNIVENTSLQSLDHKLTELPPPPIKHTRIVSTKEMKAITNKRYARLPEVLDKQEGEREERRRRANRIIRDVFNKRLQKRVRNGKLSLNHSRTVI